MEENIEEGGGKGKDDLDEMSESFFVLDLWDATFDISLGLVLIGCRSGRLEVR